MVDIFGGVITKPSEQGRSCKLTLMFPLPSHRANDVSDVVERSILITWKDAIALVPKLKVQECYPADRQHRVKQTTTLFFMRCDDDVFRNDRRKKVHLFELAAGNDESLSPCYRRRRSVAVWLSVDMIRHLDGSLFVACRYYLRSATCAVLLLLLHNGGRLELRSGFLRSRGMTRPHRLQSDVFISGT